MRAVVYRGPNVLRLETLPVPAIGAHELLVKVAACGVCPTDIKKIQHGTLPPPRIFGHETAGTVVRVGRGMRKFRPGDRVALHHHVPCLDCHACRHRAFAQCQQYKRTGITAGFEPAGGGYAEYVRVMPFVLPGVVKIPGRNSFLEAAMLEPVNTVLKAINRLELLRGDTVLVAGQGPIGLMFTRLLALRGIRVLATDLLPSRLNLATQFGAGVAIHPDALLNSRSSRGNQALTNSTPNPRISRRKEALIKPARSLGNTRGNEALTIGGKRARTRGILPVGADSVIDAAVIAVPSDDALLQAQQLVRGGGKVLLFSHTRRGADTPLDLATVCVDEKDLIGSYSADFLLQDEVAGLVFLRKLDVHKLITHQFPLEHTAAAIDLASRPTPDSLKIVVTQD